jgi:dTDP-4-dehydrorhamnose reductase
MYLVVTGASGLLGLNLCLVASAQGHSVTGLVHSRILQGVPFDLQKIDLLETSKALQRIEKTRPEAVIHCAAIAHLDRAENEPAVAHQLNGQVPGMLAEAAYRWGVPFVHISTDAVFDGRKRGYLETDTPNPLSVYARTKLLGEVRVQEANPDALIVRTVFFGWSCSGKRSLAEFFINNLKAGRRVKGFIDTLFCPLYVEDLAEIILEMVVGDLSGVYHVVSPENLSKYEFGVRIAKRFGFDADLIEPAEAGVMMPDAPRSKTLVLSSGKTREALGYDLPSVDAGIEKFYQRWREGYPAQLRRYVD